MTNHPHRSKVAPVLTKAEINLIFEWFHVTKDTTRDYLKTADYTLINRLAPYVGRKLESPAT
jgi:hypothetical protein